MVRYIALLCLILCAGCKPETPPPPPVEQNDLTVRFFRSLRTEPGEAAALQGQKLYALEKRNYFLLHLIAVQQANQCTRAAQGHLNRGRLDLALREIQKGLSRFPDNQELLKHLARLNKLRHAEKLFMAMKSAPNPAAMNSALLAARNGLSGIDSPSLNACFLKYQADIKRWQQQTAPGGRRSGARVLIKSFDDK